MAIYSFGEWIQQQRKHLRLTQREVAAQAHCTIATIKKIETDQRRPSVELAKLLAEALQLPLEQHPLFIECARGQRPLDALAIARRGNDTGLPPSQTFRRPAPLPLPATPFVGRITELAGIAANLADPDCRLLTLLGPGGIGKTRLALTAAQALQKNFGDGVVFVPLAALDDPAGIAPAVAKALNQPLTGPESPDRQLQRLLQAREMLLVLDNFEPLLAGAPLLAEWLAAVPRLKLLVTSRERLYLAEEWLYPVPGFNLDQAISLFEQTVRRLQPQVDLAGQDPAMAEICHLVDGLPLAVELAASWTRLMSCDRIAAQIRQSLDFLNTGPRNAPERHRNLRALFDHSWDLLSPSDQEALVRLSVFRGGFAPEEAAIVAGATWPVLLGLVDKSLVAVQSNGRYHLHELTRYYAAEKLRLSNGERTTRQQHFKTYLALAERLDSQLSGPEAIAAFAHLDQEQPNLRAALGWSLETGQVTPALRLVYHLFFFWLRRGYWREGEQWTAAVVSRAGEEDNAYLCLAWVQLSTFMALQGRYAEASPYLSRALLLARRLEEPEPLVAALVTLGQAVFDPEEAFAAWDEAIAIIGEDEKLKRYLATIYSHYGDRLQVMGRYEEAARCYHQSLDLMRQMGNVDMIAYPLGNLGLLALHEGRLAEAYQLIAESVALSRATGNGVGLGDWVFRLGLVLLYQERTVEAAAALQEVLTLYQEMDNLHGQASVLAALAQVALGQGQVETATTYIRQSLSAYQALYQQIQGASPLISQDRSSQFIFTPDELDSLLRAALVFSAQEQFERAAKLFGLTASLLAQSGHRPAGPLQARVAQALATIRSHLSEPTFTTAWEAGQKMPLAQLFEFALSP